MLGRVFAYSSLAPESSNSWTLGCISQPSREWSWFKTELDRIDYCLVWKCDPCLERDNVPISFCVYCKFSVHPMELNDYKSILRHPVCVNLLNVAMNLYLAHRQGAPLNVRICAQTLGKMPRRQPPASLPLIFCTSNDRKCGYTILVGIFSRLFSHFHKIRMYVVWRSWSSQLELITLDLIPKW